MHGLTGETDESDSWPVPGIVSNGWSFFHLRNKKKPCVATPAKDPRWALHKALHPSWVFT